MIWLLGDIAERTGVLAKREGVQVEQLIFKVIRRHLGERYVESRCRRDRHYSSQIMAADRSKTASNNPRMPVGQVSCHFGTYTVDEAAKTMTDHIERCTFPQWDGGGGTVSIAFPMEDELSITVLHPIQDPTIGPMMPHLFFKRVK